MTDNDSGGTSLTAVEGVSVSASPELSHDAPKCPYCGNVARFLSGSLVYPHRPDLAGKRFWACPPCDAYVGCHDGTDKPLGRLADAELRKAKMGAHAAFDPFWRGRMSRGAAYRWLATALGIDRRDCHIGMFDVDRCKQVVSVVGNAPQPLSEASGSVPSASAKEHALAKAEGR